MTSISLKHVSYRYPLDESNVIDDMSFDIEQGLTYALIGANDSGKTTVCNIIRGFIPRFYRGELSGSVEIDGKPVADYDDARLTTMIGYSFQNPFTQMSGVKDNVCEEIAYALENLGVPREEMIPRVDGMIKLLGLEALADKNHFALSGGQKQRVALAAVLVTDPDIVILDEPTSQLDPKGTEDIFDIIGLLKKQGKTIILVEHKIDLIAQYCDRVLLLDDGRLVMNGTAHDVLTDSTVLEHGGQLPQVARYYLERNERFGRHDPIPLTVDEAIAQERKGR